MNMHAKKILVVSESDFSGVAGIQGDIKTVTALGQYACTAVTSLNTQTRKKENSINPEYIAEQMRTAISLLPPDAIKIGFLESEAAINAVSDVLDNIKDKKIPVVIDPSILSRSDKLLVDDLAIATWKRRLYIHAKILAPNIKEAEILGVMKINDINDMRHAADMMRTIGVENVILKSGSVDGNKELYFIASDSEERVYQKPTIQSPHTLGAGSAFSTALAVNLAKGMSVFDATESALDYLNQAIMHSDGFGLQSGPINHMFDIQKHPSVFQPEEIKIFRT